MKPAEYLYGKISYADEGSLQKPVLLVVIDTEEEFDWSQPHSRESIGVSAMSQIHRVQDIFDETNTTPCYVVDYPVVSNEAGFRPLKEIHQDGRCLIGAHLHPWVNPPHSEEVTRYNSFPGNLPKDLEFEKLKKLVSQIEDAFDYRPSIYKAGRYGIGTNSMSCFSQLGMQIDLSPTPGFDYSSEHGPDYSDFINRAFWFGEQQDKLCIPCTGGFVGRLGRFSKHAYEFANNPNMLKMKMPGVFSRLHLVDRIRLSPEGFDLADMMKISRFLIDQGNRILTLSFHSPSVQPGCTPYVRNRAELDQFLEKIRNYIDFFYSDLDGMPGDPLSVMECLGNP